MDEFESNQQIQELDNEGRLEQVATEILKISRDTLVINMRFLDMAISMFRFESAVGGIAVSGDVIYYDPVYIIQCFQDSEKRVTREYLHMVFHCVFRHAFVGTLVKKNAWDTACDIAVENVLNDLNLNCIEVNSIPLKKKIIEKLSESVKMITAESLYQYFVDNNYNEQQLEEIRSAFQCDDHAVWYPSDDFSINGDGDDTKKIEGKSKEGNNSSRGVRYDDDGTPRLPPSSQEYGENRERSASGSDGNCQKTGGKPSQSENPWKDNKMDTRTGKRPRDNRKNMPRYGFMQDLAEKWKHIAERMEVDLDTFQKTIGKDSGFLTQNLREVTREKVDYAEFLKKFAVMGEVMQVNDDEFDYIFYTYGMKLFGKMPLIEPLEYKNVNKIKDFVIAIDTSGSVAGELVQKFIQKTYNILLQQESFFTKINVHIIQCDAEIQEDAKITCKEDMENYIKTMRLHGFGGTDFRPVFEYVETLRKNKEFTNLKGLLYFTDGYGVFPQQKTDYTTAFIFVDDEEVIPECPVWAIKLVLKEGDLHV